MQGFRRPRNNFDTVEKAYEFGIGRYGSGTYRIYFQGKLIGWEIQTK